MTRIFATLGALFGFFAVALGAFGAHALEARVTPERAEIWTMAAHYLGWHGTALLTLAALAASARVPAQAARPLAIAGGCLIAGALIFCGSLFVLALSGIGAFGAVTPIGGLLLAAGWAFAAFAFWQLKPGVERQQ